MLKSGALKLPSKHAGEQQPCPKAPWQVMAGRRPRQCHKLRTSRDIALRSSAKSDAPSACSLLARRRGRRSAVLSSACSLRMGGFASSSQVAQPSTLVAESVRVLLHIVELIAGAQAAAPRARRRPAERSATKRPFCRRVLPRCTGMGTEAATD